MGWNKFRKYFVRNKLSTNDFELKEEEELLIFHIKHQIKWAHWLIETAASFVSEKNVS